MLINFLKITSIASVKLSHSSCVKEPFAKNARHDYAQKEARVQRKVSQQRTIEKVIRNFLSLSPFLVIFYIQIFI